MLGLALATALAGAAFLAAGYLCGLTLVALVGRPQLPPDGPARRRFAILIPAHNEEALLGRLLRSLQQLDYPCAAITIYVVADNCRDQTAAIARGLGAVVYERADHLQQGKGHALRWLLERVLQEQPYDAFVILDADTVVAPNLLRRMDARLEAGSQVIQAYYSVLNPDESPVAALRYAALAALHYLRPLARARLGLSCGLKGNGMCFAAPIVECFGWRWYALAEDVEFHLALVKQGIRVDFAPETTVWADMPVTLAQARSQNERWERGRLDLLRRHLPALLAEGVRRHSPLRLDAAVEQLIPPVSVLVALSSAGLVTSLMFHATVPALLASVSLVAQVAHLLTGLALVRAPLSTYLALVYAPLYIPWKLALYGRSLIGQRETAWVRTARSAGESHAP